MNSVKDSDLQDIHIMFCVCFVIYLQTDEVHAKDNTKPGANTAGSNHLNIHVLVI